MYNSLSMLHGLGGAGGKKIGAGPPVPDSSEQGIVLH